MEVKERARDTVPLEKFKMVLNAQDRQSHTNGIARKDQRRTATIAPLVDLKGPGRVPLPLQRPSGLLGWSPAPPS